MDKHIKVEDFFNDRAKTYSKVSKWSVNEKLNKKSDDFLHNLHGDIAIELGAGTGVLISNLQNFKRKIALDISKEMLSEIHNAEVEKIVGDVHNLEFPSNYFDLIICRQLLHYCNLDIAFSNITRVLKKEGLLHIVQVVDFKRVPHGWDKKWADFRNVIDRKHLRTTELEHYYNKFSLSVLKYGRLVLRDSYSWKDFFIKHNISANRETEVIDFFNSTPEYIAKAIKLEINNKEISYNRIFKFWLLQKR